MSLSDDDIPVTCLACGQVYPGFSEGQALGCAADWYPEDAVIHGNYGSAVVDMETWHVHDDAGLGDKPGQVCDTCLEKMIEEGVMINSLDVEDAPSPIPQ